MHTDFENALLREPVQAILTCIMSYTTEEQRKVIYEKLGRRVVPVPASLEQEAERLYPDGENHAQVKRSAHIAAARQYMGEIERLRAENGEMRKALESIRDGFDHENDAHKYQNLGACPVCIATSALKTVP